MEEKFSYTPNVSLSGSFWEIFAGVLLIALPFIYPFSITLGGFTIVPYPWTIYLCIIVGLSILWSFVSKARKAAKLKSHDCTITVKDDVITFRELIKGEIKDISLPIADIQSTRFDKEDDELTLYVDGGKTYSFVKTYFAGDEEYKRFESLVTK